MPLRAWGLLVTLSVLWGGTFLFNRLAVGEIPPTTLVLARVGLAALVLLAILSATGGRLAFDRRRLFDYVGMGLLNNVIPFVLIVWGQKTIAAGLASILNATTPIFAVLLTHWMTDEKATPAKFAGVLVGILGVAVLVGPGRIDFAGTEFLAELACLGAAVSYGFSSVWSRRFRGSPPLETATGQLTASTVILLPLSLFADQPWTLPMPGTTALVCVAALAVLSTALAYLIFFRIVVIAGATSAMLVTLLIPPSAILLGWLVLGERLAPQHFAGMGLIALGLLTIDGRLLKAIAARFRST
ncbi:EamA family transporter [Prosthecomicrobium hirschii]|uniref:DMT family transporter n=1 Tax=Prosthecodimorpha hirschii TaxID=665126 RepID=UPI00112D98BA|nr:DMT family transporter [Prosthecomicrobium hirschii]TPQ52577.1 EamA family transporter [Prosthecomicrobium hirschii]